jgi:putative ubiquitin-RnfH superfamily antitoxin RatB of RatAB toxin-antitoxin module
MATAELIPVEVVVALPSRQAIVRLELPAGTTAAAAVDAAEFESTFGEIDFQHCELAVWGVPVNRDRVLKGGDRVEVLRPLALDPRDARRALASAGKSMGGSG